MTNAQPITATSATPKARFGLRRRSGWTARLSVTLMAAVMAMTGIGIDFLRHEAARTIYQNTADQAALAAASTNLIGVDAQGRAAVAHEVFARAGLAPAAAQVTVAMSHSRTVVTVDTRVDVNSPVAKFLGMDTVTGPALAAAQFDHPPVRTAMLTVAATSPRYN